MNTPKERSDDMLDNLLSQEIQPVEDQGFSKCVKDSIESHQRKLRWIIRLVLCFALIVWGLIFPYELVSNIMGLSLGKNTSAAIIVLMAVTIPIVALMTMGED